MIERSGRPGRNLSRCGGASHGSPSRASTSPHPRMWWTRPRSTPDSRRAAYSRSP